MWLLLALSCAPDPALPPEAAASAARLGDPARYAVTVVTRPSSVVDDWGRSFDVGDFNGDGAPELAVSGRALESGFYNRGYVYRFEVDGQSLVWVETEGRSSFGISGLTGVSTYGGDGASMATADMDGDGLDDLALRDDDFAGSYPGGPYGTNPWTNRVVIRKGTATGLGLGFISVPHANTSAGALLALRDPFGTGGDGTVWTVTSSDIHFALTHAPYLLTWDVANARNVGTWFSGPSRSRVSSIGALDADGDGRDELVVRMTQHNPGYDPRVLGTTLRTTLAWADADAWPYAQGSPVTSFRWSLVTQHEQPLSRHWPSQIAGVADVNLDGLPDLVTTADGDDRAVHIYAGLLPGVFATTPQALPIEPFDSPLGFALPPGDFDGDGALDILTLTRGGDATRLYRWSAASGGPAALPTEVIDIKEGAAVTSAWAGDLNLDGLIDVVLASIDEEVLVIWGGAQQACPAAPWYLDRDDDGHASSVHAIWLCDPPPGASATPGADCDDDDPAVWPGAPSDDPSPSAGSTDTDCDGFVTCYTDADADGRRDLTPHTVQGPTCNVGGRRLGSAASSPDCDDNNPDSAACAGVVFCHNDVDGDGYGVTGADTFLAPQGVCPAGWATRGGDCAGGDPNFFTSTWWYVDGDGDGHPRAREWSCLPPAGGTTTVPPAVDCDDTDPAISPGAAELPGGPDDDCDGRLGCWVDADRDDWGGPTWEEIEASSCSALGYSDVGGDCNDNRDSYYPGSTEQGEGPTDDANCDGLYLCYADADLDGWGDPDARISAPDCHASGLSTDWEDCDDTRDTVHPGRAEDYATPWDDNCNNSTKIRGIYDADNTIYVIDAPPFMNVGAGSSRQRRTDATCPRWLRGACLDLVNPRIYGPGMTDAEGNAQVNVPGFIPFGTWLQAFAADGTVGPAATTR